MTQSFNQQNRRLHTRTRIATKVQGGIHAILSLIACAAILLAGEIAVFGSPVLAQAAKKRDAIAKELKAKGDQGGCKVTHAAFVGAKDGGYVTVLCPGKPPLTAWGPNAGGGWDQIMTIALTAISTGKLVHFQVDDPTSAFPGVLYLVLLNP